MSRVCLSVCLYEGGLSVAVEGPSKSEIRCADNGDNTHTVTYYPMIAGTYSIAVQLAGNHIPGSPFTAKVIPPGTGTMYICWRFVHCFILYISVFQPFLWSGTLCSNLIVQEFVYREIVKSEASQRKGSWRGSSKLVCLQERYNLPQRGWGPSPDCRCILCVCLCVCMSVCLYVCVCVCV